MNPRRTSHLYVEAVENPFLGNYISHERKPILSTVLYSTIFPLEMVLLFPQMAWLDKSVTFSTASLAASYV